MAEKGGEFRIRVQKRNNSIAIIKKPAYEVSL
jgi:hypothetical protein